MKIQIMSDLHREFYSSGWMPDFDPDADFIVMAGDTHNDPKKFGIFLNQVADKVEGRLLCVPGNHEYYGNVYPDIINDYKQQICKQEHWKRIYFLNQQYLIPNDSDVVFLGATLWTDYDNEREMLIPTLQMNDYRVIHKGLCEPVTPEDLLAEHKQTIKTFCGCMENELKDKRVVIVTHHGPSYQSVPEMFKNNKLNGAYVSSLEWFIEKYEPIMWIHGHTHNFFDYQLGPTRVICNPVGYPHENNYQQLFTVEI